MKTKNTVLTFLSAIALAGCAHPKTVDEFRNHSLGSDAIRQEFDLRGTALTEVKLRMQRFADTCLINLRTTKAINETTQTGSMTYHNVGTLESLYTPSASDTQDRTSMSLQRKFVSGPTASNPFVKGPENGDYVMVADVERAPGGVLHAILYTDSAEYMALLESTKGWIQDTRKACPKLP